MVCGIPSQTENNQSLINKSVSLGISITFEQLSTSSFLHIIYVSFKVISLSNVSHLNTYNLQLVTSNNSFLETLIFSRLSTISICLPCIWAIFSIY